MIEPQLPTDDSPTIDAAGYEEKEATTAVNGAAPSTAKSRRYRSVVLIAALALSAAASGFLAGRNLSDNSDTADGEAVDAAKQYATLLANYGPDNIDTYFSQMHDATTGNARDQIGCSETTLKDTIKTLQLTSTGSLLSTGVVSSDGDSTQVLVVFEQTTMWKDAANDAGTGSENGAANVLTFTMKPVDGAWKVSEIESPLAPGIGTTPAPGQSHTCESRRDEAPRDPALDAPR
ncbi:hypothetical protein ACFWNH_30490 [Rhodococcus qingshengii]|uniref:hypothetical protein n=1 Tax=Rhodococcus qingshengii TaxID=334542 RepID=UPI00364904C2